MGRNSYTTFLTATPTFLSGAATIFCLGGYNVSFNRSRSVEEADAKAMRNDLAMITQDIKWVLDTPKLKKEISKASPDPRNIKKYLDQIAEELENSEAT